MTAQHVIQLLGGPHDGIHTTARDPQCGQWQRIMPHPTPGFPPTHYCESQSWSERMGKRMATPVGFPPPPTKPMPDLAPT